MLPPLNNEFFIINPNFITVHTVKHAHVKTVNTHIQKLIPPPFCTMLF